MNAKIAHIRQNRAVHFIDVENTCGSARITAAEVAWASRRYLDLVPIGPMDQVVIAAAHSNAGAGFFGWPTSAERLMGSGPDGADLRLLERLETADLPQRFDEVVVASGDHIFAAPLARLAARGMKTTVASWRHQLSPELRMAASHIVYMDSLPVRSPFAA